MKKTFLIATLFLVLMGTTSCKKLLGRDPESLLIRKPWIGEKAERYKNGNLVNSKSIEDWVLDIKKNHRYTVYHNNIIDEEGQWSYNKKRNQITFDPDHNVPITYDILKLNRKNLIMEVTTIFSGDEYKFKWYLTH